MGPRRIPEPMVIRMLLNYRDLPDDEFRGDFLLR